MNEPVKEEVEHMVSMAGNAADAFTSALFTIDESRKDTLTLFAYKTKSQNLDHSVRIPIGHGLVRWVAKNDKATHAHNFDRDAKTTLKYYTEDEAIKSFMAAPVRDGDRVISVIAIDSKEQSVFTDNALKLMCEFAVAVGKTLVRGRKMIRLDRETLAIDSLERLVDRVTACENIATLARELRLLAPDIIKHDYLALAVRSFESDQFHLVQTPSPSSPTGKRVALPLSRYRLGMVIQGGTPLFVPEIGSTSIFPGCSASYRSFLGAPMVANNETVGAVGLLSIEPKAFTKMDERILSLLMAACASAFASLRAHNMNRRSKITDPITGAHNHRYLLGRDDITDNPGAVAVLNLIGFTRINLEIGLNGGDAILLETANRLQKIIKGKGEVCRYYGDRFILLIEDRTEEEVVALAQKVSEAIESAPYHFDGVQIHVKPAIGVSPFSDDTTDLDELIKRAFTASERATITPGLRISLYGSEEDHSSRLRSIK